MKTVLVVEDDPIILHVYKNQIEKAGFQVYTASDGVEGMDKVRQFTPDVVILDVIMPRKDGFQVLHEIKTDAELEHIPVIMLTVRTLNADIVKGLKEGAVLYLPKPFHPRELVTLVKRVLEAETSSI